MSVETATFLAGDIGGTKCHLALSDTFGRVLEDRRYPSAEHADFADVVRRFQRDLGRELPRTAAFAIAGPVANDVCRTTNLPWLIDARALERTLGIEHVRLLNDFEAQALAVPALSPEHKTQIHPGNALAGAPIAILGAGTGLGEAFLVWKGARYEVVASEGGHADFAPLDERQVALWRYLYAKFGARPSYERVLSGAGLVNVYEFLRARGDRTESEAVRAARRNEDPAAVVSRFALERADPMCEEALDIFCEVYAQEAGNLALKVLAKGGVFLAGGIAAKILPRLLSGPFAARFVEKGRLGALVSEIPVWVVTHASSGLLGAAIAARQLSG
jgi:glucokinase